MSLLTNLMSAAFVHGHNQRRNGVRHRLLDVNEVTKELIVCGGQDSIRRNGQYWSSLAEEIKVKSFYLYCEETLRRKRGGLSLSANSRFLKPDPKLLRGPKENILVFGRTASYMPLISSRYDAADSITPQMRFFERLTDLCVKGQSLTRDKVIGLLSCFQMLLSVLDQKLGATYITFPNVRQLAKELASSSVLRFYAYADRAFGGFPQDWRNWLELNWNLIQQDFLPFWRKMCAAVDQTSVPGMAPESLCTALSEGRLCYFEIGSQADMLVNILLSELAMVHEECIDYDLITYYVPLQRRCGLDYELDRGVCLIGGSPLELGVKQLRLSDPSCVCLGLPPDDARVILEQMVANSNWIRTSFGFAHRSSYVNFHTEQVKPITEHDLSLHNIPDGSAYRLDRQGLTYITALL